MTLERYRKKRSFPGTPEPEGAAKTARKQLTFVIQKHAASRLHYDFRLEWDGVLKSWAVPKGPSRNPKDKRMAVHVEDHPVEYATFEGVIPEKRYGAGNVIVWDHGTYSPDEGGEYSWDDADEAERRMQQDFENGKLSFTLRGGKLHGSWTLVHTKGRTGEQNAWLLIKHKDEYAITDEEVLDDMSVVTHRTLEDVSRGVPAVDVTALGETAPFPSSLKPMLATLVEDPFTHKDWLFEPKLDGVRALTYIRNGKVDVRARSDNDITDRYPEVVRALETLPVQEIVLDGEIVTLNEQGLPDFELLQSRMHTKGTPQLQAKLPAVYYIFDILYNNGRDLRNVPLTQRKALLSQTITESNTVRLVHTHDEDGEGFFNAVSKLGLEGMVGKAKESRYDAGNRSKSWLKIKAIQDQEFVVAGYLPGKGHRSSSFGALVLGYYDGDTLKYAGTVGSGFDDAMLAVMDERLKKLVIKTSPFNEPILRTEKPTWTTPELVVRVKFNSWTRQNVLRAPVFMGLRDDIMPKQVGRESAAKVKLTDLAQPKAKAATVSPKSQKDEVESALQQLDNTKNMLTLEVNGQSLKLTNLNKELWPALGKRAAITKRDFIRYFAVVSPYMLPHLSGRPMNLTRYPNGFDQPAFYQKHWATDLPDFVESVELYSDSKVEDQRYTRAENMMTLLWYGQLATIELHPWLSRIDPQPDGPKLPTHFTGSEEAIDASVLNYPDFLIFDLDPYIYSGNEGPKQEPELNREGYQRSRDGAFAVKGILEELGVQPFVKLSGKTGVHVYVPVMRHYDYPVIRKVCAVIGKHVSTLLPGVVTMEWATEKRTGKIFFDHNQNSRGKTLAGPYSLRPSAHATVSTPISWEELATVYPTDFTIATVPLRLKKQGDPWRDILNHKHDLRSIIEAVGEK